MLTKPYITLLDRDWKGKVWYTSYRSVKNVRRLNDEEARPFLTAGTIQEVILPTYGKNIMGVIDGKMVCNVCTSRKGFYIKKRPFGKKITVFICAGCGVREVQAT